MGFWGYMCIQLHIDTFRELMIATDDFVPFGSFLYRKLADALASVWQQYCCFDALLAALNHIKALVLPLVVVYPIWSALMTWRFEAGWTHKFDPWRPDGHGPLTCNVLRIRLVSTAASVELQRVLRSEYFFCFRHVVISDSLKWISGNLCMFSREPPSCRTPAKNVGLCQTQFWAQSRQNSAAHGIFGCELPSFGV